MEALFKGQLKTALSTVIINECLFNFIPQNIFLGSTVHFPTGGSFSNRNNQKYQTAPFQSQERQLNNGSKNIF